MDMHSEEKNFRYPGAHSFLAGQKDLFFGREKDIDSLAKYVALNQISVLYSKSGLGKSSLLNAGMVPHFEEKGTFRPVPIRFKAYNEHQKETPTYITRRNIVKDKFENTFLDLLIKNEPSMWHDVKEQQICNGGNAAIILIFDQFEELFDYPAPMIQEFKEQLAELLFSTLPQRYRNKINSLPADTLSASQLETLYTPFQVHVIFSIRNDKMSLLNGLKDYLPTVLKNCYELKPLDVQQAEDAIINPALNQKPGFSSPPFAYTYPAVEKIIHYLTKNGKRSIESFQLQVLCHALELRVIDSNIKEINQDNIGDLDDISQNYYLNQLATITGEEDRLAARKLLEEGLIFEQEQRRISLLAGIIERDYGVNSALLQKLVESRLLRPEPLADGTGFAYELSHDSLIAPILKAKEARLIEQEKDQLRQQADEAKEKEFAAKRKQQKARMYAIGAVALALVAIISSIIAFTQAQRATSFKEKLLTLTINTLQKDVEADFFDVHYDQAFNKILAFNNFSTQNQEVLNQILELTYFSSAIGNDSMALIGIQKYGAAKNDQDLIKRRSLSFDETKRIVATKNVSLFKKLEEKYFPAMIALDKYGTSFGKTEVTIWQYNLFCEATGNSIYNFSSNWGIIGNYPIVKADWYEAIEYANWLSEQKGYDKVYTIKKVGDTTLYINKNI